MNGETLLEALTDVDPALVQAAGKARRRPAWRMWAAAAACVCLLLAGTVQILYRLDYFRMGCSAVAGTLADGAYYYNEAHSGVWRWTPGEGSKKLVGAFWEDGWLANDYGVYYSRGRSLFVRVHETGETRRLCRAPRRDARRISFSLTDGGDLCVTLWQRDRQHVTELLLDGKTGTLLQTLRENTDPLDDAWFPPDYRLWRLGSRTLELSGRTDADGETYFLLTENGVPVLPEGQYVLPYPKQLQQALLVETARLAQPEKTQTLLLLPDGTQLAGVPHTLQDSGVDGWLLYTQNNRLWRFDLSDGTRRALDADAEYEACSFVCDGTLLMTCVPWDEAQTCWRLVCDEDGAPVKLELVCRDIRNST